MFFSFLLEHAHRTDYTNAKSVDGLRRADRRVASIPPQNRGNFFFFRGSGKPMKTLREELWFNVEGRRGYLNITPQVEALVRKSGVKDGLCLVNAMHITASVYINDNEQGLLHDYDE